MSRYIKSNFPEDKEFELLPEGEHIVKVEAVTEKQSKSGNDMIEFELKSIPEGQLLWLYALNTGNNRWMLKKVIQAITGVKQPHGDVSIDIDDLIGRRMKVVVEHELYNGQLKAKVKDVIVQEENSPGQTTLSPDVASIISDDLPF